MYKYYTIRRVNGEDRLNIVYRVNTTTNKCHVALRYEMFKPTPPDPWILVDIQYEKNIGVFNDKNEISEEELVLWKLTN